MSRDWLTPWNAAYESFFGPAIEAARATYARPPDPATPALPLAAYAGSYVNAYVGKARISVADEALRLCVGPEGMQCHGLKHFDRDIFLYHAAPELPDLPYAARFEIGPDGTAMTVLLESLDDNGMGRLARAPDLDQAPAVQRDQSAESPDSTAERSP